MMPDQYRIIFLPRSAAELIRICSYIERGSEQGARSVATRIIDAIDALAFFPHRYEVHEHRKDSAKTVRSMPVPPFIVYYRVDDSRLAVRILSVRHGARRQPKRFK
jgi:plasmid stabilization system protein ParE